MRQPSATSVALTACVDSEYAPEALETLAETVDKAVAALPPPRLDEMTQKLGHPPGTLAVAIREAADPERRTEAARMLAALSGGCACSGDEPPGPTFEQRDEAAETLSRRAIAPVAWMISLEFL